MAKPNDVDTYAGWLLHGRSVRSGQKAMGWAVERGTGRRIAVFSLDQTESYASIAWDDTDIVARADAPEAVKKASIKLAIEPDAEGPGGTLKIWVGGAKVMSDLLRRSDFKYSVTSNRWCAHREDAGATSADLQKFALKNDLRVKVGE